MKRERENRDLPREEKQSADLLRGEKEWSRRYCYVARENKTRRVREFVECLGGNYSPKNHILFCAQFCA